MFCSSIWNRISCIIAFLNIIYTFPAWDGTLLFVLLAVQDIGLWFFFTCRHPTSCCSAAEIMSTLFFYAMKYKVDVPRDPANDRFILSKVIYHIYSVINFFSFGISKNMPELFFCVRIYSQLTHVLNNFMFCMQCQSLHYYCEVPT